MCASYLNKKGVKMKNFRIGIAVFIFSGYLLMSMASVAEATPTGPTGPTGPPPDGIFIDFKIVDAIGEEDSKNVFYLSETPYLYYSTTPPQWSGTLDSDWEHDGETFTLSQVSSDSKGWVTFGNWDSIKALGSWNITGDFNRAVSGAYGGSADFTVIAAVPEPSTYILFMIGGIFFVLSERRRRRALIAT
jgi:hypothetical protein